MPGVFDRTFTAFRDVFPLQSSVPTLRAAAISFGGEYLALEFKLTVTGNTVPTLTASGGAVTATYLSGSGTKRIFFSLSRVIETDETVSIDLVAAAYTAGLVSNAAVDDYPVGWQLGAQSGLGYGIDLMQPLFATLYSNLLLGSGSSGSVPINLVPPSLPDEAPVGEAITVTPGHYFNTVTRFSYTWYRYPADGDIEDKEVISGETTDTYTLVEDDADYIIFVSEKAAGGRGSYVRVPSNGVSGGSPAIDPTTLEQAFLLDGLDPFYTDGEFAGGSHFLKNYGTLGTDAPGYASQWAICGNAADAVIELGTQTIPSSADFTFNIHFYNRTATTGGSIVTQRGTGNFFGLYANATAATSNSVGRLSVSFAAVAIELAGVLTAEAWHWIQVQRSTTTLYLRCKKYGDSSFTETSGSVGANALNAGVQTKLLGLNTPAAFFGRGAVSNYSVTTGGATTYYPLCSGPGSDGTNRNEYWVKSDGTYGTLSAAIKNGTTKSLFRIQTDYTSMVPSWAMKYGAKITANRVVIPGLIDSSLAADGNALTVQPGKFATGSIDTNPLGDATATAWASERNLIPSVDRNANSSGKRRARILSGQMDRILSDSSVVPNADSYCSYDVTPTEMLVFVGMGESNVGGIGNNASASAPEVAARPSIQIFHNTAYTFQDLDIGTNNLVDHLNLTDNATHGIELGLANEVEAGTLAPWTSVMLCKHGGGGTRVLNWLTSTAYATDYYPYEVLNFRHTLVKDYFTVNGISPKYVIMNSLGINDQIAAISAATWKPSMLTLLNRIKRTFDGAEIVMTKFMTGYTGYDTVIDELAASEANVYAISGNADAGGGEHWTYAGLKVMAERLTDQIALIL